MIGRWNEYRARQLELLSGVLSTVKSLNNGSDFFGKLRESMESCEVLTKSVFGKTVEQSFTSFLIDQCVDDRKLSMDIEAAQSDEEKSAAFLTAVCKKRPDPCLLSVCFSRFPEEDGDISDLADKQLQDWFCGKLHLSMDGKEESLDVT